jgi:hypothetical protein
LQPAGDRYGNDYGYSAAYGYYCFERNGMFGRIGNGDFYGNAKRDGNLYGDWNSGQPDDCFERIGNGDNCGHIYIDNNLYVGQHYNCRSTSLYTSGNGNDYHYGCAAANGFNIGQRYDLPRRKCNGNFYRNTERYRHLYRNRNTGQPNGRIEWFGDGDHFRNLYIDDSIYVG